VTRKHAGAVGQSRQLPRECFIQHRGVAAIVTVPGSGIEKRVTAEQRRFLCLSKETHVRHGVARRIHTLQLDGPTNADDVTFLQTTINPPDARCSISVCQYLRARLSNEPGIATGVIEMLMSIQNLGDFPALGPGLVQHELPFQGIHCECFAGLRTRNQVVVIAEGIRRPDAFDQHKLPSRCGKTTPPDGVGAHNRLMWTLPA
jgi:hypothetical protein